MKTTKFLALLLCVILLGSCTSRKIDERGQNSRDTVELLMEFEKEFNIGIPDEAAEKVITVGDAVDALYKLINK